MSALNLYTMNKDTKILITLSAVFISMLVISNVIAVKTISIAGMVGPAAVICYSLTFAITDTLSEIWGKKTTQFIVMIGFLCVLLSAIFVRLAVLMPGADFWNMQDQFSMILGSNMRIVAASLLAYIVSQTHDLYTFHFLKEKTNGKHLWLRNNISSMISQLLDTVIFIVVGFAGLGLPLWSMIWGQLAIKIIIALLDTPLVYLMVSMIRKDKRIGNGAQLVSE